jgi:hypothetical protein
MSAADHLQPKQFLDLYHGTSPENAAAIRSSKSMTSKTNIGGVPNAYFSTHADSEYIRGFGGDTVHVRVPAHLAQLEDEFPSGEQHYTVPIRKLRPEHFH